MNDLIDLFKRVFEYKNGQLFWKEKLSRSIRVGCPAGTINGHGYIQVQLDKKLYGAHRIIWMIHNGAIPDGYCLDHIDGNTINNYLHNLRLVTQSQNLKNRKLDRRNKSGVHGVYFHKSTKKWRAYININGKNTHLGLFDNIDDAKKARKSAEQESDYHSNHGRRHNP